MISPAGRNRRMRFARPLRALIVAVAFATAASGGAHAQERPSRVAAFTDFFRWQEPIPAALRSAFRAYEEGRFFTALGNVDSVIAARKPAYALDDALFLRSLSLIGVGWDDVAVPSLRSLIEADPPGPYYVPALLELVEIHDRAGRWTAIADTWERYVDRPLRSGGSRNQRIARLLFEFGSLRPAVASSTRREKSLLARPKELAVILEKRRERPSDRLLYRSGLALLRLSRHEESLRALFMIGIESPYYPYARYSIAQDLFAAGRTDEAARTLGRLERYPKITREERALGSRAQVLDAAISFESGEVDEGIRIARSIADDDAEAPAARWLIAAALLDAGKPSLALVYDRAPVRPVIGDEARRALVIGSAYASLGDKDSATRMLRAGARHVHQARVSGPALEDAVERVRALAEASVDERRSRVRATRAHISEGMQIVLAHDGPWSFATMLRRVRAALGAGSYRELALGTKPRVGEAAANGGPWLTYLASPRRAKIERLLERIADVEAEPGAPAGEASLRILNGYLVWLEQAPTDAGLRQEIARRFATFAAMKIDADAPPAAEVAAFRRRLLETADALRESSSEPGDLRAAREDVVSLLGKWVDRQLHEVLRERDAELRDLEFDLEVALSEALGPASGRE